MATDSRVAQLARELSRYLETHPEASDTLDGIARWWLARQRYDDARELVGEALELLVDCGVVRKRTLPDGVTLFEKKPTSRPS
jgi:hypothetical protein